MTQDSEDWQLANYDYFLPPERIAQRPLEKREEAKMLVYERQTRKVSHRQVRDLPQMLPRDICLVRNISKVFPCRLFGEKPSGGKIECFLLSPQGVDLTFPCLLKSTSKKKMGDSIHFSHGLTGTIVEVGPVFRLQFNRDPLSQAQTPIPPYIRGGQSDERDKADYQTLHASELGSVAAPTAGLHFTSNFWEKLERPCLDITLHVGLGTFAPVKTENIKEHTMHKEWFSLPEPKKIEQHWGNILAIGTTTLRALESCQVEGKFSYHGPTSTDLFLYPGKNIHSCRGLLTNFHLPKSSLLVLVATLIGRKKMLELYTLAIERDYRFFSYGDCMLIL